MLFAVTSGVFQFESLRQIVVDLHGSQLPFSTENISHHEVNFRTVEGGLARLLCEFHAETFSCLQASSFRFFPCLRIPDILAGFVIPQPDPHAVVIHSKSPEDDFDQLDATQDLVSNLLLGHEQVRIILSKTTYAGHS